jgi:hypothetical protein
VQPKNITFPTDAKRLQAALNGLNRLARRHGVRLRQSYLRVAKRSAMMAGRYAHAKQFNRHRRELRFLRTRLGRLIRETPPDNPALWMRCFTPQNQTFSRPGRQFSFGSASAVWALRIGDLMGRLDGLGRADRAAAQQVQRRARLPPAHGRCRRR